MGRSVRFWGKALALLLVFAVVAGACGDDGGDDASSDGDATPDDGGDDTGDGGDDTDDDGETGDDAAGDPLARTGFVGTDDTEATPTEGGTLTFGPYAPIRTLDPAATTDAGVGNAEISAIYDALMRFDYAAGEYVPWQAESVEYNDDFTVWTVKLRDGILFSDGTPLDSAAVALQMERSQELRPGNYTDGITTETPDDLTVVYTLPAPWAGFEFALAANPGRIPSPTAVEAAGEDFGTQPVGAGPFVLESWTQGEEMVLARNENYWGEGPYLDGIRFLGIRGDQARLDSMASGEIDAGFLRSAAVVNQSVEDGFNGFNNILSSSEILVINNGIGDPDAPGSDLRVRQAIAHAIDTDALNEVVDNGVGLWGKEVFSAASAFTPTVPAAAYDPDAARALLDEAKADGYDGKITLTCDAAPEREREGIALQAQLNAVGFDVELNVVPSVVDTIRAYLSESNYELACYGYSFEDVSPYSGVARVLTPGETNRLGYFSDMIGGALEELRAADGTEETIAAVDTLQEVINAEQPYLPLAAVRELIAWDADVHGMDVSAFSMPLFNEVWIEQ